MQQHLWVLFGSFIQQVLLSQACLPLPISFIQLLRLSGPELGACTNRNRVLTLRGSQYDGGGKCLRGQAQHRLVLVMMGVKLGLYFRDTEARSEALVFEFWLCHRLAMGLWASYLPP